MPLLPVAFDVHIRYYDDGAQLNVNLLLIIYSVCYDTFNWRQGGTNITI